MKKNILKIKSVALLGLLCFYTSCSDYLDTEPIVEVVTKEEQPIKNVTEAEGAMSAVYSQLGGEFWQFDQFFIGDAQTDNSYAGADNVQMFQIDEYRMVATNTISNRDWGYIIDMLFRCNFVLNYIDNVKDLSAKRKEEMKAEASFFRAFTLFKAVQIWGDFPIITKAITSVNQDNFDEVYAQTYPERKPVAEVYAQILADLDAASTNIPSSDQKYKANKAAVNALKAKVNATKPSPDWNQVIQNCDKVIAEGYTLLPVYEQLFDGNHEGNAESIFEANGGGWGSPIGAWGASMFYGTDWKKFNTPSNALVTAYDDEGDVIRKNSTIWFAPNTVPWSDNYWPSNKYPFANKMRKTDGTQNFYIFRFADVLLLKAEALAQNGDAISAMAIVNQVRSRAKLNPISAISKDEALSKILRERKLELAFEGEYWFDLKRFGKAVEILSKQKDGKGNTLPYASSINTSKLIWPVPQSKIDANKNLKQNPGY